MKDEETLKRTLTFRYLFFVQSIFIMCMLQTILEEKLHDKK